MLSRIVSALVLITVACSARESTTSDEEIPLPDRDTRRESNDTTPPPKETKGAETNDGTGSNHDNDKEPTPTPALVACTKPSTCPGATPVCCGELGLGEGTLPSCPILGLKGTCATACTTNLSATCPVTQKTRLCEKGSDCAADAPSCCYVEGGGYSGNICVPTFFATVLQKNGSTCN